MIPHTTEPHAPGEFGEPPTRPAGPGVWHYVRKVVKPVASLQLTVVLFVLGMGLIFFGTLAQLDFGIWTVVDKYFWSWVVWVPFDLFHKFLGVFWKEAFPPDTAPWSGEFPFPAGKLIGGLMLLNLLAAHALRFRISWKRLGILFIHSGLILLFVGEFITREYAIEQRMTIAEGESANYTEEMRHVELVFIDPSDPQTDREVTIPENMLKAPKGRITHPDLPVDVAVTEYMTNSEIEKVKPDTSNPADSGLGKMWTAVRRPEVSGVDPNQQIDVPSVYVKLYKKGTDNAIGTYLGSLELHLRGGTDEIPIDGKNYKFALRFKRHYKPYRVYLDKFRFDRYMGTEKAKNYSSDVRVYDDNGNLVIHQQHIAMNEPLRYDGETFYQADFDHKTEKGTILQVVKNPGWLLPYISCVVVGLGLVMHFLIYLIQFLKKNAASIPLPKSELTGAAAPIAATSRLRQIFPWAVAGFALLYLLSAGMRMTPAKQPFDYDMAAQMRVVDGGRDKPLDTVARVNLRMISGREEFVDEKDKKQPAIRWYLDVITTGGLDRRGVAWKYKVIRIDNEQVLKALDFKVREGFRFSMDELAPKFGIIQDRMEALENKVRAGKKLDTDETKFKELGDRIQTFLDLAELGGPPPEFKGLLLLPPSGTEGWTSLRKFRTKAKEDNLTLKVNEVLKIIAPRVAKFSEEDENKVLNALGMKAEELTPKERANAHNRLLDLLKADPTTFPAPRMRQLWLDTAFALMTDEEKKQIRVRMDADLQHRLATQPTAITWEKMLEAYREGRANEFAHYVDEYNQTVNAAEVPDRNPGKNLFEKLLYAPFNSFGRNKVEITFNRFAPFYQCAGLYVFAFILAVIGFTQQAAGRPHWGTAFRRSAFYLLVLTFIVHSIALFARMYIMQRPMVFVTNLYSSAIFIGLGCVGLCLIIERIFPMGVGNMLAALLGLVTTIVAHNLATEDTLEMMQAVLDTNFWLATHVTTVTLGYTATFVAGFLGALYVFQMLGAVIRDSYQSTGEPTVGDLLAFSVATLGVVGIPLTFLWFMTTAMAKFELLPSEILWGLFMLATAIGVVYAIALMLLRVGNPGVDSRGKPLTGQIPNLAQPVAELALTPERGKIFGQMVYGVVCFATLLSFVGTVLGGIWADQSWGRFWGWDPKENGAVLIVLWNSLILHARWAGLVKDRGVAVLAIFGNVMTAWSWFGTNQLSIGLHAYGFDSRLADGCFNFWLSQAFILGLGLIPQRFWASVTRRPAAPATAAAAPATPAPPTTPNVSANGNPSPNGSPDAPHTNGQANGHPNGQPHRDKKKRSDKRK